MRYQRAFTAIDMLVLTIVVTLALGLSFAIFGPDRRRHYNRVCYDSRLGGIAKALGTYGSTNKDWYPGIDNTGQSILAAGQTLAIDDRFRTLLLGSYFTPEFILDPVENDPAKSVYTEPGNSPPDYRKLTSRNYSYSMLQVPEQASGRRSEWAFTSNSQAVILADRAKSIANGGSSIHQANGWRGSVAWNDAHAGFETQWDGYTTKYGKTVNQNDNLFFSGTGDDALLVHSGN